VDLVPIKPHQPTVSVPHAVALVVSAAAVPRGRLGSQRLDLIGGRDKDDGAGWRLGTHHILHPHVAVPIAEVIRVGLRRKEGGEKHSIGFLSARRKLRMFLQYTTDERRWFWSRVAPVGTRRRRGEYVSESIAELRAVLA
jgi:hypothetical protein